jgi:hypothetical protein
MPDRWARTPIWRFETRHPATLLIDEDRRRCIFDRFAQRSAERSNLLRIGAIAREKNEPERLHLAKKSALFFQ